MLATFNDTWDWTAVGTLALAAVTLAAVIVAAIALRQTRADITLSRKEVEEAHRPVVVPVLVARAPATASVSSSRYTLPRRPVIIQDGLLGFPVQNIGSGPALRVEATIRLLKVGAPRGPQKAGTAAGIGVSEVVPLEIEFSNLVEVSDYELTLTYEDVADKGWLTVGRWNADDGRYTDLTINTQKEGTYGLRQDAELVKPVPPGA